MYDFSPGRIAPAGGPKLKFKITRARAKGASNLSLDYHGNTKTAIRNFSMRSRPT